MWYYGLDLLAFAQMIKVATLASVGLDYGKLTDTQCERLDFNTQLIVENKLDELNT